MAGTGGTPYGRCGPGTDLPGGRFMASREFLTRLHSPVNADARAEVARLVSQLLATHVGRRRPPSVLRRSSPPVVISRYSGSGAHQRHELLARGGIVQGGAR